MPWRLEGGKFLHTDRGKTTKSKDESLSILPDMERVAPNLAEAGKAW